MCTAGQQKKFRFCGDLDCPDWVLAEITILSKITSVKMKLLCVQVIKDLLDQGIDYEKVYKLTSDAKFETGDVKASIAALTFVLSSAAKYNVDGDSLSNELQQLGLPKVLVCNVKLDTDTDADARGTALAHGNLAEHTTSLTKSYSDNLDKLQTHFRQQSLRLSRLESVEWRVDYILSSSELKDINEPCVQLRIKTVNPDTDSIQPLTFTVTADKFRVLLNELKQANGMMETLSS